MKQKLTTLLLALASTLLLNLAPLTTHAAATSMSMVASKSTVASGGSVIVALYINGGGNAINAVQYDLNFPASKLQYVGYSASGSAFEIAASSSGGDGFASIARGTTGSITGSALVGTVTLRAVSGTGSAAISIASSSSLVSNGNAVAYQAFPTTINFGAAAPEAPSTPTVVTPEPPKDTAPPIIANISQKNVTPFAASIAWTTDQPADSVVEYGLDQTYGLSASLKDMTKAHEVALSSAFLQPKTVLHYRLKSTDGAGNVAVGKDQTLLLPGVPITVVVIGADGQPQAGAQVTIDNETGTTNSKGQVTLPVSLGNKRITTSYNGITSEKAITVAKETKTLPPYKLTLGRQPINRWMLVSAGLTLLVLLLLVFDALLFGSHYFSRLVGIKLHPRLAKPVLASGTTHEIHNPVGIGIERAPRPRPDQLPISKQAPKEFDPLLDGPDDGQFNAEAESNTPLSELMKRVGAQTAVDTSVPPPTKISVVSHEVPAKPEKSKAKAVHHKKATAKKKITIS